MFCPKKQSNQILFCQKQPIFVHNFNYYSHYCCSSSIFLFLRLQPTKFEHQFSGKCQGRRWLFCVHLDAAN
ncbi:hypothetical protein TYRP_011372 [Tyrophagus putrescentiae]|nr:hypothetical protein TYRP_011372 [Tyrophagus putrescentiae]